MFFVFLFVFPLAVGADEKKVAPSCPLTAGGYDDRFAVAQLLISQRNVEQAEACLNDAVASTLGAYSLLSDIAAAKRDGRRALAFSAVLETLNPRDGETVYLHAQRLGQVGRWRDALPRLEDLSQSNPNNFNILNTYGVALYHTKNYTGAVDHFQRALELAPNNTDYKANLDAAHDALKGPDEAEEENGATTAN